MHPDLVRRDISMPKMGRLEAARRIKEACPEVQIVFVTIYDEQAYRLAGRSTGVDGFVCKSSASEDFKALFERMKQTEAS